MDLAEGGGKRSGRPTREVGVQHLIATSGVLRSRARKTRHAPAPELVADGVALGERGAQPLAQVDHREVIRIGGESSRAPGTG